MTITADIEVVEKGIDLNVPLCSDKEYVDNPTTISATANGFVIVKWNYLGIVVHENSRSDLIHSYHEIYNLIFFLF